MSWAVQRKPLNHLRHLPVSLSLDKLDGKTSEEFYQEHLDQRRAEQENISERIKVHQNANVDYCEKGLSILELANKAYCLYLQQTAEENANSSISCF
jgi:hypothetical protein